MSNERKTQRFIRYLTDVDLLDVRLDLRGNRITGFRINSRAFINDTWKEIVRYDTAHGRLHVHHFWPPHRDTSEDLEAALRHDYTVAVTESLRDLHANWQTYRDHVERE